MEQAKTTSEAQPAGPDERTSAGEGVAPDPQGGSLVSFVVPVLDEEGCVAELHERIAEVMERLGRRHELIFVDDGSTDSTLAVLREISARDARVRVVEFRRNFGKSAALDAGFRLAAGEVVFTMDADLQDDPEEIPRFLETLDSGYDLVSGWKHRRRDPLGKTLPSRLFNGVTRAFSGLALHDFNCGFKAYRREVTQDLDIYGELHRYIPVLAHGRGFRVGEIPILHHPRTRGRSKFGVERFARGFYDLLTATVLTRFSRRPLHLMGSLGLLTLLAGTLINLYLTYIWFFTEQPIGSRPLLSLGVLLMIVGVQFFSLGLIGDLLVSVSHRTRPHYAIRAIHGQGGAGAGADPATNGEAASGDAEISA